jgi:hypothetical protein
VIRVPFLPASSPAFVAICFLGDSCSDWGVMGSQCSFDLISFVANYDEHFLMYLVAICTFSSKNCLFNQFFLILFPETAPQTF